MHNSIKVSWHGRIISIQPRIRLTRSFDERYHTYLGYVLHVEGEIDDRGGQFLIGIGKAAQAKHLFKVGDVLKGESEPVADDRLDNAEFYKTAHLKIIHRTSEGQTYPPPWDGIPPSLEIYRERGHRRLDPRTYRVKCISCIWGCRMPVEMILDPWDPRKKRYRFETFCYGPKSCPLYRAGSIRKVPGRKGMTWEEEDWIDEESTAHRDFDE